MDNAIFNETQDRKIAGMEEKFRSILEQTLSSFLERQIPVTTRGPKTFEFKDMKSALPGEVVVATMMATEGGPGKIMFVMTKEGAGMIADLLLMGDGKAAFSYDEHLEPIRDMLKDVMAGFSSELSTEIGHRVFFDEIKVTLVDMAASDFVGKAWVANRMEIGLQPPQILFRIISGDFCQSCFPDTDSRSDSPEGGSEDDTSVAEAQKEMGLVLDIELPIAIELGRTSMLIRDVVKLAPGSIVELDKLSGEPVDVLVNGRLFARGEVVVVDENFAIRVTELVMPPDFQKARSN